MPELPRERVDVSAHVQLGVHGVGDIVVQCGNTYRGDVLCELVHFLLNLKQGRIRRKLLLHQRRGCWRHRWTVHVHIV